MKILQASGVTLALMGLVLGWFFADDKKSDASAVEIGTTEMKVIIVDTPELRVQGLSGRESLAPYDAMLFVFPESSLYSFWMKDMHFAIDIVWIDEARRVVDMTKNVNPDTYPQTFAPNFPSMYVLELPAGQAKDEWLGDIIKIR